MNQCTKLTKKSIELKLEERELNEDNRKKFNIAITK